MKQVIGIAITTCPDKKTASSIVESLLADGLIACGQVEGPIESTYFWNGKLTKETEWRVQMKFVPKKIQQLEEEVMKLHPYENPQWTNWEAIASDGYHEWVHHSNHQDGAN
jgi:periplasmic divalent cation tolerance protein